MGACFSSRSWLMWLVETVLPFMVGEGFSTPASTEATIARVNKDNGEFKAPENVISTHDVAFDRASVQECPFAVLRPKKKNNENYNKAPRGDGVSFLSPPLVVYLHGGAYVMRTGPVHWGFAATLSRKFGGAPVALVDYPLAPASTAGPTLDAVARAYEAALAASSSPGQRVVVVGDSAGGGLALALAQRLVARGGRVPDALVLFSPWVDVALEDDVEQMRALEKTDAILKLAGLRACGRLFAGAAAAGGGARDPRASPLFGDCADERLPKTVVFAATGELLLPQLRRLRDRMPAARYVEAAGVPHGWPVLAVLGVPESLRAVDEAVEYVRLELGLGRAS